MNHRRQHLDTHRGHLAPHVGDRSEPFASPSLHCLLTAGEVATLLRTSRKAVYAMIEREQLPGLVRLGRRVLVQRDDLLHCCAISPRHRWKGNER